MGILKKGDKVRIKSLKWYRDNCKNGGSRVETEGNTFVEEMKEYCGKEAIITDYFSDILFHIDIDSGSWGWTIGMIETDLEMSDESIFKFGDFYVKVNLDTRTIFPEFFNTYQEARDYEY